MLDNTGRLIMKAKKIADFINAFPYEIRIISHYDADGITAASILTKALAREGKQFRMSFVKQLTEDEITALKKENNKLFIFLDMGSGQLHKIQENLMKDDTKIIVCDHHQIQGGVLSDKLMHLNPINFDILENLSGSGVAYILAKSMNIKNKDLSELAIIGAIGDSQIGSIGSEWGLFGLNKEIVHDAVDVKKIIIKKGLRLWGRYSRSIHKALEYSVDPYIPKISGSESASVQFLQELGIKLKNDNNKFRSLSDLSENEQKTLATGIIKERIRGEENNPDWIFGEIYELLNKGEFKDASEFATLLNSCGKLGMAHLGTLLCLNNFEHVPKTKEILEEYRKEIGRAISWVNKRKKQTIESVDDITSEGIYLTNNANYVLVGEKISENIISNVISIITKSCMLPNKPTFGFANTEDNKIKVSARYNDKKDTSCDLKEMITNTVESIGGEGGGHSFAAGAFISKESLKGFINSIEKYIKSCKQEEINIKQKNKKPEIKEKLNEYERKDKKMEGQGLVRYFGA